MIADEVAPYYAQQLWSNPAAAQWLLDRGLRWDTVIAAKLGYNGVPLNGHASYYHSIVVPYLGSNLVRFRYLNPVEQKYDQPKFVSLRPYMPDATDHDHPYVTEGEFDALILRQLGFPAMGLPGTQSWRHAWRWLFRDCSRVTLVADGDPLDSRTQRRPGLEAMKKVQSSLGSLVKTRIIELPEGHDSSSMYVINPDDLRERLQ